MNSADEASPSKRIEQYKLIISAAFPSLEAEIISGLPKIGRVAILCKRVLHLEARIARSKYMDLTWDKSEASALRYIMGEYFECLRPSEGLL
jgi:hypothetical protein